MITKETIANQIAENHNLSKAEAKRIVNEVFATVVEGTKAGEKVFISDFGTFTSAERKARDYRNPQNKEIVHVDATNVPRFSAAKSFKDAVASAKKTKKSKAKK